MTFEEDQKASLLMDLGITNDMDEALAMVRATKIRRPCFYHDGGVDDPVECGSWETCGIYVQNPRESWASCRWGGQEYGRRAFQE